MIKNTVLDKNQTALKEEAVRLVAEIRRWRARSAFYRIQNITYFMLLRILIPFGSLAVASSVYANLQGQQLFSERTTLLLAILVVVFSGLDVILNPGSKKVVGFKTNNLLRELEARVRMTTADADESTLREQLLAYHSELRRILDEYADRGY